jgi:hypothetical protein
MYKFIWYAAVTFIPQAAVVSNVNAVPGNGDPPIPVAQVCNRLLVPQSVELTAAQRAACCVP